MKIRELMQSAPTTCRPGDRLDQVTRSMWSRDLGWLPVVDDEERLAGVLTDRDACMHATTSGRPLSDLLVKGCMQAKVITCAASDSMEVALARFSEHQIHRLPVVDEQQRLVGVLTLGDLARAWRRETTVASKNELGQQAWEVFCAIRRPHGEAAVAGDVVVPVTRKAPPKQATTPAKSSAKNPAAKKKPAAKKSTAKKGSAKGKGRS